MSVALVPAPGAAGECLQAVSENFFYLEADLLYGPAGQTLSRDELLALLLYYRGYDRKKRCSTMGAQAARLAHGSTGNAFALATKDLNRQGVDTPTPKGRPQVPQDVSCGPRQTVLDWDRSHEPARPPMTGTCTKIFVLAGREIVKLPWCLVDGLSDGSIAKLADLPSVESVRLLVSMYAAVGADGLVPAKEAWILADRLEANDENLRGLGLGGLHGEKAMWALAQLLKSGLLLPAGRRQGTDRTMVRLAHVHR